MPATFSKVKKMAEMIEVVVECLGGILSPRSDVRHKSEEELKALEVSEGKSFPQLNLLAVMCHAVV